MMETITTLFSWLWSIAQVPYAAIGYIPFIGGVLQGLIKSAIVLIGMWALWKVMPQRMREKLIPYLTRATQKIFSVFRKVAEILWRRGSGERVVYRDRVVAMPFRKAVALRMRWSLMGALCTVGYYHQTALLPWMAWAWSKIPLGN